MSRLIAGVDEAGRGCVVGPMVVSGVLLRPASLDRLREAGVRDSKRLTAKARRRLCRVILKEAVKVAYVVATPFLIDMYVGFKRALKGLNALELEAMAYIVEELKASKVYIDCPDVNIERFLKALKHRITYRVELVVSHREHDNHPALASASIAAKVLRDEIVRLLKSVYGDFGSGYPSDLKTRSFIRRVCAGGRVPPCVRRSWKTLRLAAGL